MQISLRGIVLLLIAAPIMAASTWLPQIVWVARGYLGLCLALFISDWRMAHTIDNFAVSRIHDTKLSMGADNPITIRVRNRGRRFVRFWVRDEAPVEFKIQPAILTGDAAPRNTWEENYFVYPFQRGDYFFGNLNLRWQGPLGLIIRQGKIPAAGQVKVYPNLLNIRQYDILLKQNRLQEIGLRNTRMFGEGTEYERLREYVPDDDYRRIDWKATARRNRPITVEYQTERSQNVMIVLDVGRMSQSPVARMAKLDYVVNTALLLTYVATGKGDKVGLMTFADQTSAFILPRQGRGQFFRILESLYRVEAQPVEPDYGQAFSYLGHKLRKRSLLVIFTDLSGGIGMQMLKTSIAPLTKHSLPLVVTISDPEVHEAAQLRPVDSFTAYQRVAAEKLLEERQLVLDELKRKGVLTLDVPANRLNLAVINHYLELKGRMML